jgi:hypothetical protein
MRHTPSNFWFREATLLYECCCVGLVGLCPKPLYNYRNFQFCATNIIRIAYMCPCFCTATLLEIRQQAGCKLVGSRWSASLLVTPVAVSYLRSNTGGSRFKKHESLGKQTTQDTYYDRNGLLFSKGVYIRQRNGHWEAKIRTGGDFINSAFTEVDGNKVINQNLTISADGLSVEEMLACRQFVFVEFLPIYRAQLESRKKFFQGV